MATYCTGYWLETIVGFQTDYTKYWIHRNKSLGEGEEWYVERIDSNAATSP